MSVKKSLLSVLLLFAVCLPCLGQAGPTYFKPFNLTNTKTNESFRMRDGSTFRGVKNVSRNGNEVLSVGYAGTITMPSGERLISFECFGFDANCRPVNGFFLHLDNRGNATQLKYANGAIATRITLNQSQYRLHDNIVSIVQTAPAGGGYYNGGGYNSGSSSSGSSYNSHKATCRGCNGSGRCQHCSGRGYTHSGSKCSLCHGTGRCQSCAGLGYLHL